ncbi:flagellar hook-length control protein FliK [Halomonas sp. LBP4]|uniref:flagellar hook-length control protein FliK n=1 Tax=Halomonas sp. LBP4 TaxID=2044917 RepID=UPI000D775948|nr:flagellar hook-length control protein FliK [Halomonas sp. LBP4]PXX96438.1 flagellar hook-length control protein FliK [Halomonas sp. LBP4]
MSGINLLIDTLLHQVLGKRVDTPPPKALNEPVKPVAPSEAPRALHSDSRLDARASSSPLSEVARTARPGEGAPAGPRPAGEATPPSTQTHFSPSARSIADLLIRFPAPPSVVRPPLPLVTDGEARPSRLAERLQGSVRDSGLFYESHLARWFRGELPRGQLQREPQMWRTQRFSPASPAAARERLAPLQANMPLPETGRTRGGEAPAGIERGAGPVAAGVATPPSPPPAGTTFTATAATGVAGREPSAPDAGQPLSDEATSRPVRVAREPLHESLQGIVRHQLEMLAMPVLRWEGDIWTGIFMALVVHLPPGEREGEEAPDDEASRQEHESQGWRSAMTLQVAGLGEVGVDLWLRGERLDLALRAHEAGVLRELEQGIARLTPRLEACGLEDVRVCVRPAGPGGAP